MKEVMFILLVAFLATWVAVPPGAPAPALVGGGGIPLPDVDHVAREGPASQAGWNPLLDWLTGQLWGAVYALETI